ncbi:hypothetical Protein YC6258_03250 [Gynuella sunshinyii YC6258]|uniref:Uncharacterized protein n=1 Tax=Gynuella sunshinyii YC6258 TaxID=1445510 RepID=A0A0C5VLX6_9GAMM|nr:hypothetical Protein YC6258_03250 [Gynuella sunshinyii YC6258]
MVGAELSLLLSAVMLLLFPYIMLLFGEEYYDSVEKILSYMLITPFLMSIHYVLASLGF